MRKQFGCLLFVIVFCVTQGHGQDQRERQEAQVRELIAKFADARNKHDLPTLIALYAYDAEWISSNGGFNRGRQAILTMWSRQVQIVDYVDRTISQN